MPAVARREELTDLGWLNRGDSEKENRGIYKAWHKLPADRLLQIEGGFWAIFALLATQDA
jgi:hypothetical protein